MPKAELSGRELRLLRMRAQRLLPGAQAQSVSDAASKALTLQGQDVPAALLGVRARVAGVTRAEACKQAARSSVCRSWLMRNTIFLFASRDLAWMRPLLSERPLVTAMRRLSQEGVDPANVDEVLALLTGLVAKGPLPRADAIAAIRSLGVQPGENNQRIYWLIHAAALRGVFAVRPALDRKQVFVAAPPDAPLGVDEGLGLLARRYLEAYGPATADDFAYFFKITKADAIRGWEHRGRTAEVTTELGPMTTLPGDLDPPSVDRPVVHLLGVWDHYLLGWRDRSPTMPKTNAKHARQPAGYATAFADGRAFGVWRIERRGESVTVEVEPFDRLPRRVKTGLEREAADIGRFLGAESTLRIKRS